MVDASAPWVSRVGGPAREALMATRKRLDERLETLPKELRDPPVAFAALSFVGPLFILLLALAAGQSAVASPLYTLAALVFVAGVGGFLVTSYRRYRVQRAEAERREARRARVRRARRPSAARISRSRPTTATTEEARTDARRAS
jgi:pilus assembly protein TadC